MNAEFNWWLLIVGLVVGAGLVWLVIADWSRREEDIAEDERSAESAWIAEILRQRGESLDPAAAEEVLALHRAYLRQSGGLGEAATEATEIPGDEVAAAETGWVADGAGQETGPMAAPPEAARPSVRASNLRPRSGTSKLESEPPA